MTSDPTPLAIAVGINHVALEVGDVDAAVDFYQSLVQCRLRGHIPGRAAFIDFGDQFLALMQTEQSHTDSHRHFGLVADDLEAVKERLQQLGVEILPGRGLDFRDPWGNRVQVVQYSEIQFMKTEKVASYLNFNSTKSNRAIQELREKGISIG